MVTIYNTTLSATSQRHFSDSLGGVDEKRIENNDGLAGCDGIVRLLRGPRMA